MELSELILQAREIIYTFTLQAREANPEADLPEITVKQFYYLNVINNMKKPTCSELAERLNVSKPAVTAIANKLIDLGCLKRIQCNEDRRVYYILLDDKGRRLIEQNHKTLKEWAKYVESCLTQDELNKYAEILEKVIASHPLKKS